MDTNIVHGLIDALLLFADVLFTPTIGPEANEPMESSASFQEC
jgi:hypothetical protein